MNHLSLQINEMFTAGRGDRSDADNVCVIITNANSNVNPDRTLPDAIDLRNTGAYVIAVGVGSDLDILELRGIASQPHGSFLFSAPSQNDLPGLEDDIVLALCDGKPMQ